MSKPLKLSLSIKELKSYTERQIGNTFPDNCETVIDLKSMRKALDRLEYCLQRTRIFNSNNKNDILFDHLHSDQYLTYLWFLSNQIWADQGNLKVATKIYYLNKSLHSFDCLFNNQLPKVFFIAHGIGTVLGKATYGNYLFVNKGVSVGANWGKDYPKIGARVSIGCDATVIGNCMIGDKVSIGAGVCLFNKTVEKNSAIIRDEMGCLKAISQKEPYSNYVFFD